MLVFARFISNLRSFRTDWGGLVEIEVVNSKNTSLKLPRKNILIYKTTMNNLTDR